MNCKKLYLKYKSICGLIDMALMDANLHEMTYEMLIALRNQVIQSYVYAQKCGMMRGLYTEKCVSPERRDRGHATQIEIVKERERQLFAFLESIHQQIVDIGVDEPPYVEEEEEKRYAYDSGSDVENEFGYGAAADNEDALLEEYEAYGNRLYAELLSVCQLMLDKYNIKYDSNTIDTLSMHMLDTISTKLRLEINALTYPEMDILIEYIQTMSKRDLVMLVINIMKENKVDRTVKLQPNTDEVMIIVINDIVLDSRPMIVHKNATVADISNVPSSQLRRIVAYGKTGNKLPLNMTANVIKERHGGVVLIGYKDEMAPLSRLQIRSAIESAVKEFDLYSVTSDR